MLISYLILDEELFFIAASMDVRINSIYFRK